MISALFSNSKVFKLLLQLIALHSFAVGVGLILLPSDWLLTLGFVVDEQRQDASIHSHDFDGSVIHDGIIFKHL